MRKLVFLVALPVAGALLGITPAAAQPTPGVTAFCDATLEADDAADKVLGAQRPKRKDVQALDDAMSQAESTAPPEVAANVQAVVAAVRTGIENREDPFDDPNFESNFNAMQEYRYNSCGYRQLDVTGIDYEFEGLPETLTPGLVAIRFTDTGDELHELAIFRLKTKDSLRKVLRTPEKEQRKKVEEIGGTFAMPGQTTYEIADLSKPGRYGVVCFLPVGSTSIEAAEEAEEEDAKAHWHEGMLATIRVEEA